MIFEHKERMFFSAVMLQGSYWGGYPLLLRRCQVASSTSSVTLAALYIAMPCCFNFLHNLSSRTVTLTKYWCYNEIIFNDFHNAEPASMAYVLLRSRYYSYLHAQVHDPTRAQSVDAVQPHRRCVHALSCRHIITVIYEHAVFMLFLHAW